MDDILPGEWLVRQQVLPELLLDIQLLDGLQTAQVVAIIVLATLFRHRMAVLSLR